MVRRDRKAMIDRASPLPLTPHSRMPTVGRSSVYYRPAPIPEEDMALVRRVDEIHLGRPLYGRRTIRDRLLRQGHRVNRRKEASRESPLSES
jgi:putative transposase